jgi:hypothetical protein
VQFIGYIVYIVVFTALLVFDELEVGALGCSDVAELDSLSIFTASPSYADMVAFRRLFAYVSWWYCLMYSVLLFKFELHQVRCALALCATKRSKVLTCFAVIRYESLNQSTSSICTTILMPLAASFHFGPYCV